MDHIGSAAGAAGAGCGSVMFVDGDNWAWW